jgi:formate dehydrogenase major subunit
MKEITLTINGKQVKGKEGDTVLDICQANSIDVPTLCHYKGLSDVGACRLCVVDIERERRPVPACTYPARDGLVIQTHNEKLEKYRRLVLELLFTERNHLCAQCVASGDCELQSLAYKYQMDNARYPYSWPALPVDSVNNFLVIDHNRCILCGRCIRTCDEIVGVHTLDFGYRGWKDMVVADLNQPLGASSCISCGACFQVCPTGAIFSKSSAYKGKPEECEKVSSVCPVCGVGCRIEALVKDNRLVRIDSPDLTDNRGILCYKGRFTPLYRKHERIDKALVRNGRGKLESRPLGEAMDLAAKKLAELKARYGKNSIVGIASSQASNESLKAFKEFITGTIGSDLIDTLDGDMYRAIIQGINTYQEKAGLDIETSLEDILKADCILVAGANPVESHPVAGSYIARAAKQNKAKLIVIDSIQNTFAYHTTLWLKPKEGKEILALKVLTKAIIDKGPRKNAVQAKKIASSLKDVNVKQGCGQVGVDIDNLLNAARMLSEARHSIIIYGEGILQHKNPGLITALLNLATIAGSQKTVKPRIMSLKPKGNSRGAWDMGIANSTKPVLKSLFKNNVKALYLLLADDYIQASELASLPKSLEFVVIQSSYLLPIASKANIVLPSPIWSETAGKHSTLDGKTKTTSRLIRPPEGVKTNSEILREISRHMKNNKQR